MVITHPVKCQFHKIENYRFLFPIHLRVNPFTVDFEIVLKFWCAVFEKERKYLSKNSVVRLLCQSQ